MPKVPEDLPPQIAPLGSHHDRAGFSCGIVALDEYLKKRANQDARKRVAAPFVLTIAGSTEAIGYYTLSAISLLLNDLPRDITRKLPQYPAVPATLLGRLAVDSRYHGMGLGEHLLMNALHRSLAHSGDIASFAVVVDAIDKEAERFYARYEFQPFPDQADHLFLPMRKIAQLF